MTYSESNMIVDKMMTPLHVAAMNGNVEICKLILNCVDDKNPKGKYGYTPLFLAATNGHFEVCKMIIERVKDKNLSINGVTTPFRIAAHNGHYDIFS